MELRHWLSAVVCGVLLGCGRLDFGELDARAPGSCDPDGAFDPPQRLGLDPSAAPADPALSPDELTLYLTRDSPDGDRDLFVAARHSVDAPFGAPVGLGELSSPADDAVATISADGRTMLFHSRRGVGEGDRLYAATRADPTSPFGAPLRVLGVQAPAARHRDLEPFLSSDGEELWFVSDRGGTQDIHRAIRTGAGFGDPVAVPELCSPAHEQHVMLSDDRLTAYFASTRDAPGARGSFDVYRARRAAATDRFGPPVLVPELNTEHSDNPRWLSPDGCRLYLHSNRGGRFDIYVATRRPEA